MDIRDPNLFDMNMNGNEGIGDKIRAIFSKYHTQIKICEMEVNMEAPDADAEIYTNFTDAFTGAARNVDTVVAVDDVSRSLQSTYFWFYVSTTQHYIWIDVDNLGSDPSVAGTAHEVDIAQNDNAATVGAAIVAVIDAIANISASGAATMIIENDNVGVVTAAAVDGASTSTGFAFSNTIAGAAAYTASYFYAVSSDAKDTAAGVGTQAIRVFIIDENGGPNSTDIEMGGATPVRSSVKATEIVGVIGIRAGAEADTAGTLTIVDNGENDVYCTIAAAGMGSVSARCWVPDGWSLVIGDYLGLPMYINDATGDIDPEQGACVTPIILGLTSGVTQDILDKFIVTNYYRYYRSDFRDIVIGANGAYHTLNHETKADDKNLTYYFKIRYILWKEA